MEMKDIIIRLLIATLIASAVGFDREFKNRPAGIRTYILVCVGSAIIALIQQEIAFESLSYVANHPENKSLVTIDNTRMIAQVVSGIGFLGAGTIIVTKRSVKGLTTAASLWAVAGLGIAVGLGYYEISVVGCLLIVIVLSLLNKVIKIPTLKKIEISFIHKLATKEYLTEYFDEKGIEIRDVDFDVDIKGEQRVYTNIYTVELPKGLFYADIVEELSLNKNMMRVRLINA